MKIKELIQKLEEFPEDWEVVFSFDMYSSINKGDWINIEKVFEHEVDEIENSDEWLKVCMLWSDGSVYSTCINGIEFE